MRMRTSAHLCMGINVSLRVGTCVHTCLCVLVCVCVCVSVRLVRVCMYTSVTIRLSYF